jgi:ribonuclease E
VLRAIEEHLISRKAEHLTVKCTREVAFYVLNEKRDNLLTIEQNYGISVFIVPSDEVKGSQAVIEGPAIGSLRRARSDRPRQDGCLRRRRRGKKPKLCR